MFQYLTGEDWEDFEHEHNRAYIFLLERSLIREKEQLTRELQYSFPERKVWIEKRLAELKEIG